MKDSWQTGGSYECFMGRWSSLVATSFTDWFAPPSELKWLDIGCGSGALSEAIINKNKPAKLIAIDQSESLVNTAKNRLESMANCIVGSALSLPVADSSVDATVSGLVLNFIPEPEKVIVEMRRVTAAGGDVAVYIWDYAGKLDFLNHFWDIAVELNPKTSILHEGQRFPESNADGLIGIFKNAGFVEIETTAIEITTNFRDFDDYWKPFLGGQGPAPTYVQSLGTSERIKLRDALLDRLPIQIDCSISMLARAWAAPGVSFINEKRLLMKIKTHIRIFLFATLVWIVFLLAGMPGYYLQYSNQLIILFVLILLIPISIIVVMVFKQIKQEKRLKIALWYAFYFTVPLFIYDSIYCGVLLGYGINFIIIFWFLSVYYLIPWILFPLIATVLNEKHKQE